jgi:50S ribosomal subunit-associated GTPase HflX
VRYVFNKMDIVPGREAAALRERVGNLMPGSVFVSTVNEEGLQPLRQLLARERQSMRPVVRIRLPSDSGRWLAELYRDGEVVSVGSEGSAVVVRARADEALLGRLRQAGADVTPSARVVNGSKAAG